MNTFWTIVVTALAFVGGGTIWWGILHVVFNAVEFYKDKRLIAQHAAKELRRKEAYAETKA